MLYIGSKQASFGLDTGRNGYKYIYQQLHCSGTMQKWCKSDISTLEFKNIGLNIYMRDLFNSRLSRVFEQGLRLFYNN